MNDVLVQIILGSASDMPIAKKAADVLDELKIGYEIGIASAHRTPLDAANAAQNAKGRGVKVIIAIAGLSAALPGVLAAHTPLPVIGVPVSGGTLGGLDALLSITQMPPGVPVASCGIDGAKNAALMCARILGLLYPDIQARYEAWSVKASEDVAASRVKIEKNAMPDEAYKSL